MPEARPLKYTRPLAPMDQVVARSARMIEIIQQMIESALKKSFDGDIEYEEDVLVEKMRTQLQMAPNLSHDRFTLAPGVANASEASWQLLGNTIQREVLASLCAPFLDGLVERRNEMIREMMSHRAQKAR